MALDVDPMTVSRFERGVTLPSLLTFQQIAITFGVSMAQMLEDAPAPAVGDESIFVSLMKSLAPEEQEFFMETLKRYRVLVRHRRK